jgi:hypothetical protein
MGGCVGVCVWKGWMMWVADHQQQEQQMGPKPDTQVCHGLYWQQPAPDKQQINQPTHQPWGGGGAVAPEGPQQPSSLPCMHSPSPFLHSPPFGFRNKAPLGHPLHASSWLSLRVAAGTHSSRSSLVADVA